MTVLAETPGESAGHQERGIERVSPELGQLSLIETVDYASPDFDATITTVLDRDEEALFEGYDRLRSELEEGRDLEGLTPLGKRQAYESLLRSYVSARTRHIFLRTTELQRVFSLVPDGFVSVNQAYYFRTIKQVPTREEQMRHHFRPIAALHANMYPEVHVADRIRYRLGQDKSRRSDDPALLAAGDLVTILGMSIDMIERRDRLQPDPLKPVE